ncbi:TniQ family protein [Anaerotruncus colihominis]|uniref:TniQ family protein n=1 Tax=Anaerotruncus colihominis TaxID=169435 RepID=UPI000D7B3A68|nr:TniQ family protein [Anaerotruncus colihominis]PWM14386.1 MAG: hypothetical protein DBX97_23165 [Collinsella tanakaei]
MIRYFPTAYPDELLYSQLSRYYVKSGYLAYIYAAEELYQRKAVRPDMEFVNPFTSVTLQMITKRMTMEDVIMKHTMFPYYGHFLPYERRQRAFQSLVSMQGNYHNLMPIPNRKNGFDRYLRYCPLCAEQDRDIYGETYWHRTHQIIGINACPIHSCCLINSSVVISGSAPPMLKSAEEAIPASGIAMPANELEYRLAKYMTEAFQADVDMQSDVAVGQFLHSKMANTKYRSTRGQQRNISLFHADFTKYYQGLSENWFTELWQIQKVLTDDRVNFYEICLIAMFLDILVAELVNRKLPEKSQQELFDESIYRLHERGAKYPEIAKHLNASYHVVKSIGERLYGTYHKPTKTPLKCGAKAKDWDKIDNATLPLVKDAIRQLQGDGATRPKRITISTVEKRLHLSSKRIALYLPRCRGEIEKYVESQEQYWAREIVWAANQIILSGGTLTLGKIEHLTNMRHKNIEACIPFLSNYTEHQFAEQIQQLL